VVDDFKERFLADRARALATVLLTRRDDLTIDEAPGDAGLDFLVHVRRDGKPVRPMFGVLLRAAVAPATVEQANKILTPTVASFQRLGRFTYPVCLFFFTMREDQAFFAWLAEPILGEDGSPRLHPPKQADCRELDNDGLDAIVDRVLAWYDALEAELIAE